MGPPFASVCNCRAILLKKYISSPRRVRSPNMAVGIWALKTQRRILYGQWVWATVPYELGFRKLGLNNVCAVWVLRLHVREGSEYPCSIFDLEAWRCLL